MHYNSLYTTGGDSFLIFLLATSIFTSEVLSNNISLSFVRSMNLQMFLLDYRRKSIGSSRQMADYQIVPRTEFIMIGKKLFFP